MAFCAASLAPVSSTSARLLSARATDADANPPPMGAEAGIALTDLANPCPEALGASAATDSNMPFLASSATPLFQSAAEPDFTRYVEPPELIRVSLRPAASATSCLYARVSN